MILYKNILISIFLKSSSKFANFGGSDYNYCVILPFNVVHMWINTLQDNIEQKKRKWQDNITFDEEEYYLWLSEVDEEKAKQKEGDDSKAKELAEELSGPSVFMQYIESSEKWQDLLSRIVQKQEEYKKYDISNKIKDIMPNIASCWIPVTIHREKSDWSFLDLSEQIEERIIKYLDYAKTLDDAFWDLSYTEKKEIKKIVTRINLDGMEADPQDNTLCLFRPTTNYYWKKNELKSAILHELTHLKHNAIYYTNPLFSQKINEINHWIDQKWINMAQAWARLIWKEDCDWEQINEYTFKYNGWQIYTYWFWKWFVENKLDDPRYHDFLFWPDDKTKEEMWGDRWLKRYFKEYMWPRHGVITPYWRTGRDSEDDGYYSKLGLKTKLQLNKEELSTIVEEYYYDESTFKDTVLSDVNWGKIWLDEKYDNISKNPEIRKKLRLLIDYGFFPEGKLNNYFES